MSGLEDKRTGSLGQIEPQNWKAKKARGVGKATNREKLAAGKSLKTEMQTKRGGWEDNQPGEFGAGKTPKRESKEGAGSWEGKQPRRIWGG